MRFLFPTSPLVAVLSDLAGHEAYEEQSARQVTDNNNKCHKKNMQNHHRAILFPVCAPAGYP